MIHKIEYKRNIVDKIISNLNSIYFFFFESLQLKYARYKNEYEYSDDSNPLVSVYTPTFNRSGILIERALKSVLNQTYKNFEYIIIGDCCTDDTEKLISKIDDYRIKFINLQKRDKRYPDILELHWLAGPVIAANNALENIQGKWILRLDDDDIWTPNHIEILLRFAQKHNFEFVSASYEEEREGIHRIMKPNDDECGVGGTSTWLYRSYLNFFRYNIDCWRRKWNRVNDKELRYRMLKAGVNMGSIDKVVSFVLPRPGESTIGLDAYRNTENEKAKHFEFR